MTSTKNSESINLSENWNLKTSLKHCLSLMVSKARCVARTLRATAAPLALMSCVSAAACSSLHVTSYSLHLGVRVVAR